MKSPGRSRAASLASGFADLGFAKVDLTRRRRQGYPEVVYGAGKTPAQIVAIARTLFKAEKFVLITRTDAATARAVRRVFSKARWHESARIIQIGRATAPAKNGFVGVVAAGTSDLPVAEEAAVTLEAFGFEVRRIYDVGVAGLHRLLAHEQDLRIARALIVAAGMEGALPSVVAGLVECPVIAVPTSIGYGANFQGLSALLGMLTSCASGLVVVNIDNGFGAAFAAARILSVNRKR